MSGHNPASAAFHAPRFAFVVEVLERFAGPSGGGVLDIGYSPLTEVLARRLRRPVDALGLEPDGVLPSGPQYRFDLTDAQDRGRWRVDLPRYDIVVCAEVIAGTSPPARLTGSLENALYRLLPGPLREGITLIGFEGEVSMDSMLSHRLPGTAAITPGASLATAP